MKEEEIYQKALQKWGYDVQIDIAIEEMAELTVALIKHNRDFNYTTRTQVREEVADVIIMLEQLKIIFNPVYIGFEKEKKLERLKERLGR